LIRKKTRELNFNFSLLWLYGAGKLTRGISDVPTPRRAPCRLGQWNNASSDNPDPTVKLSFPFPFSLPAASTALLLSKAEHSSPHEKQNVVEQDGQVLRMRERI
jgi:hypothetical protein